MFPRCLLLVILHVTSSLCQYMLDTGAQADMTFGADNDRFDVGNIIADQNRAMQDKPTDMDYEGRRRSFRQNEVPLVEILKYNRQRLRKSNYENALRRQDDFAYHDQMVSESEESKGTYNENLDKFKTQLIKRRRGINPASPNERNFKKRSNIQTSRKGKDLSLKINRRSKDVKRRAMRKMIDTNADNEILLQYAVPFQMRVDGYLEVPEG